MYNHDATIDIDLDSDGRFEGFVRVNASTSRSPFSMITTPIVSLKNGPGPMVLLIGGCHGDEYEGQIAMRRVVRRLKLEDVCGQVVVLPAANMPAIEAGMRTSPIDNGNLNRAFVSGAVQGPTEIMARFIEAKLMSRASLVIDIHSGGSAVDYLPSTMLSQLEDAEKMQELIALARQFGLPHIFIVDEEDAAPTSILGACDRNKVFNVSAEVGGGAGIKADAMQPLLDAVLRLLNHVGVNKNTKLPTAPPVKVLRRLPLKQTVFAPASGLFEPAVVLGDQVEKGQSAGFIHDLENVWQKPVEIVFSQAGLVLCRRIPAAVRGGDGLFKLAVPWLPN